MCTGSPWSGRRGHRALWRSLAKPCPKFWAGCCWGRLLLFQSDGCRPADLTDWFQAGGVILGRTSAINVLVGKSDPRISRWLARTGRPQSASGVLRARHRRRPAVVRSYCEAWQNALRRRTVWTTIDIHALAGWAYGSNPPPPADPVGVTIGVLHRSLQTRLSGACGGGHNANRALQMAACFGAFEGRSQLMRACFHV